jgi:hypothetical protein
MCCVRATIWQRGNVDGLYHSQGTKGKQRSSDLEDENGLMNVEARRYGGLGEWRLMSLLSLWSEY